MITAPKRLPGPPPYLPQPQGTRYLLPCPLLGHGGLYDYVLIDTPHAARWLTQERYVSCLTHPLLAATLEELTGLRLPPPQRTLPRLGTADEALIFTLEGYETLERQLTGNSARVAALVAQGAYRFGFLRRLA
jgi:hypothetical protein